MRNRLRRYSSRNCHVSAPSKRRTRTEAMELGLEVAEVHAMLGARLRLQRLPMSDTPTSLAANIASVRSPQMYSVVDSGCPVILTVPNSKYTHGPPLRRHSEQLHLVATVGVDGSVRRTAPQWHEPSCMKVSEAKKRTEPAGSCAA